MQQVNAMSATLREQRLGAMEATTLLRKVMEEINVAVFAFDGERRLRLVNRAGERLLNEAGGTAAGESAELLGLAQYLEGEAQRTEQRTFPGGTARAGASAAAVSRRRPAASVAGGHRSDASLARGRAESLAAAGAGDGP
jgi:nitrogen fixation/metabolism regulation signal transduction histidine kinase